ncbi:hypothetical protein ATN01_00830 [Buchnera aphidicola (Diuraphis noxia)]|uniref:Uncharacterized protein n=1 Tax=Buchnera aphidicola subsp. Diuraphis noxia TaxID=118101 RepID=A0A1B2H842_BUCDN|nr:hypothetical protein ATN01_00830 [Buchnera aphidicola (Diuraphis noxia)]
MYLFIYIYYVYIIRICYDFNINSIYKKYSFKIFNFMNFLSLKMLLYFAIYLLKIKFFIVFYFQFLLIILKSVLIELSKKIYIL